MGHLTFVFAGDGPFEQRSCFAHHFSCCTRRFDSSESASISRPLWSAGSTLSVEGLQKTLSSFVLKAKRQISPCSAATVRQEGHAPMEDRH